MANENGSLGLSLDLLAEEVECLLDADHLGCAGPAAFALALGLEQERRPIDLLDAIKPERLAIALDGFVVDAESQARDPLHDPLARPIRHRPATGSRR